MINECTLVYPPGVSVCEELAGRMKSKRSVEESLPRQMLLMEGLRAMKFKTFASAIDGTGQVCISSISKVSREKKKKKKSCPVSTHAETHTSTRSNTHKH